MLSKAVDMHFGNSSDLIEPVKGGTVKALAVSTPKRMPQLPNVPAVAETVPGFEYIAWNGYAVTGGVPAEVRSRLAQALQPITRDPQMVEMFAKLGHRCARHHSGRSGREHPQGHADLRANCRPGRCAAKSRKPQSKWPGLVPAIHALFQLQDVNARHKAGHNVSWECGRRKTR